MKTDPYTLTDWQAKALPEDRLSLLIEPLQAPEQGYTFRDYDKTCEGKVWWQAHPESRVGWAMDLPHAVGDRLACNVILPDIDPGFCLEVVAVTVKRLQEVTEEEAVAAGSIAWAEMPARKPLGAPDLTADAPIYALQKWWPHQPPWADNPWCAFTEVRKV